jgi:hypothetical protein
MTSAVVKANRSAVPLLELKVGGNENSDWPDSAGGF